MENSTLVKLLSVLSENEIRLINRRLKAFDRNELLLKLFNYLINNLNKPNKLVKENVYKVISVEVKKFSDKKFTRLRFQLFHFIENEILYYFLSADDNESATYANYFRTRSLYNFYEIKNMTKNDINNDAIAVLKQKKLLEMKQHLGKLPLKNEFYFLNKYTIANELYYTFQNQGQRYIDATIENLDTFFCIAKMKIGAEIGQRNLLKQSPIKNKVFENILNFSKDLELKNVPLMQIYRVIGLLYQKVELSKLKLLKNLIFKNANILSNQDVGILTGIFNNFTISSQFEQTDELLNLKYQVIKFAFDKGVFKINGEIRPEAILNFSFISFELKKVQGLKNVLNNYCPFLEKKSKYKIQKLCESYIYILEQKFMLAFNILDNNSFYPYNLLAKVLRLRCVYELEISKVSYFDGSLYDESLVFKRYLNRQLNDKNLTKSGYDSFMNLTNFLLDVTNPAYTKKELFEMLEGKYKDIRYKKWCIEKVNNLA